MTYSMVPNSGLTAIADAIRDKTETYDLLSFPSGFIDGIYNIGGGGDIKLYSIVSLYGVYGTIPYDSSSSYVFNSSVFMNFWSDDIQLHNHLGFPGPGESSVSRAAYGSLTFKPMFTNLSLNGNDLDPTNIYELRFYVMNSTSGKLSSITYWYKACYSLYSNSTRLSTYYTMTSTQASRTFVTAHFYKKSTT